MQNVFVFVVKCAPNAFLVCTNITEHGALVPSAFLTTIGLYYPDRPNLLHVLTLCICHQIAFFATPVQTSSIVTSAMSSDEAAILHLMEPAIHRLSMTQYPADRATFPRLIMISSFLYTHSWPAKPTRAHGTALP